MGYAKRKLKPVKERPRWFARIGVLLLIVVGVLLCSIVSISKFDNARVADEDAGEAVLSEGSGDSSRPHKDLDLGDYSNLADKRFCEQHRLDSSNVRKSYDSRRGVVVYRHVRKEHPQETGVPTERIAFFDECSNRIVRKGVVTTMVPESRRELDRTTENVIGSIIFLAKASCEGNPIVASSPNVRYRGCDLEKTFDSISSAVRNVATAGKGVVMVQWETPRCYIGWKYSYCYDANRRVSIFRCALVFSERLIQDEDYVVDEVDRNTVEDASWDSAAIQQSSGKALDMGDYSDLKSAEFCRRHSIDASKVRKHYDSQRRADVYVYKSVVEGCRAIPGVWLKTVIEYDECSNRIVERNVAVVMTAKHDQGTVEFKRECVSMAELVVDDMLAIAAYSREGNNIVASSPGIKYRGCDEAMTGKVLGDAINCAIKNSSIAAIQWETSEGFVAWNFLAQKGVYTTILMKSDRLIRAEVFGNE